MLVLGAWAAGGAVALAGALAYAELGQQFPKAGGQYVYLRDAWHPVVGFLYGRALLLMIQTGGMAAVGITFARYALRLAGQPETYSHAVAIAAIVLLTVVNYLGVTIGSRVLNVFVVLKVAALAFLVLYAAFGPAHADWWRTARLDAAPSRALAFGAALIPILFAYGGWQNANYVAEEMRDPRRDLPRSLLWGTGLVVVIYVLINVAYLRTLGLEGLAATGAPAADTAGRWVGARGSQVVAAAIAVSTFGFLNMAILGSTRVYYAMAADGAFFAQLGRLHPRFQTPGAAILLQSAWAIVLLVTGGYEGLLNTVVFADWIFFGLTVASLFVLRRSYVAQVGFRTPGYPWLPAAFVAVAIVVVFSTIREAPLRSAVGAGLLFAGVPVYWLFSRKRP
jgi:APA family basic amino acid/polyamine antiporter